jgi:hypothetical protein
VQQEWRRIPAGHDRIDHRKDSRGSSDSGSVTKISTFRLTAGTGTAATSGGYAEGSSATFVNLNNGNYTEGEGAIQLLSANLAAGDTVDFRVYGAGPVALTTYNQTPRVTGSGI